MTTQAVMSAGPTAWCHLRFDSGEELSGMMRGSPRWRVWAFSKDVIVPEIGVQFDSRNGFQRGGDGGTNLLNAVLHVFPMGAKTQDADSDDHLTVDPRGR